MYLLLFLLAVAFAQGPPYVPQCHDYETADRCNTAGYPCMFCPGIDQCIYMYPCTVIPDGCVNYTIPAGSGNCKTHKTIFLTVGLVMSSLIAICCLFMAWIAFRLDKIQVIVGSCACGSYGLLGVACVVTPIVLVSLDFDSYISAALWIVAVYVIGTVVSCLLICVILHMCDRHCRPKDQYNRV